MFVIEGEQEWDITSCHCHSGTRMGEREDDLVVTDIPGGRSTKKLSFNQHGGIM